MRNVIRGGLYAVGALLLAATTPALAQLVPVDEFVDVSAAGIHSCGITREGALKCWGAPLQTQRFILVPETVSGLDSGVQGVAAGDLGGLAFTCAIDAGGAVLCGGSNQFGQLGDNTLQGRATMEPVVGITSGALQVATGNEHSCARMVGGTLKCWGRNQRGQLGTGNNTDSLVPIDLPGLAGVTWVAAGSATTCVVASGVARCWGANELGQLGDGSNVDRNTPRTVQDVGSAVEIDSNGAHGCARTATGALLCWGLGDAGALGNGSTASFTRAQPVFGLSSGVQRVSLGGDASCAIVNGGVRCWGNNEIGQLGDGTAINRFVPNAVPGLGSGMVDIDGGSRHFCAVRNDGRAFCWGNDETAALGSGITPNRIVPSRVAGSGGISAIASGPLHTCAVAAGGVFCWGRNASGELGLGDGVEAQLAPAAVPGLSTGWADVVAEGPTFSGFSCARSTAGAVKCWGSGEDGQLGNGTTDRRATPTDVFGLGSDAVAIGAGGGQQSHACAVMGGGSVRCWGGNQFGQLGDSSTTRRLLPVEVQQLGGNATDIALGGDHSCAILAGGRLRCWGRNDDGQLGDSSTTHRSAPVDVVGLGAGVVKVGLGSAHTCALLDDQSLRCWGSNGVGQLGNGTFTAFATPQPVLGLDEGVTDFEVGGDPSRGGHTCAILTTGAVRCWGQNFQGQIGDGSGLNRSVPADVRVFAAAATRVDLGDITTCAVSASGLASCWGDDAQGQIGDGRASFSRVPVAVLGDDAARRIATTTAAADADSGDSATDATGRFTVFQSESNVLVGSDGNPGGDIFRRDGASGSVEVVSLDDDDTALATPAFEPAVSGDGQLIVFVAADAGVMALRNESKAAAAARRKAGAFGVFLRNMQTGRTVRIGSAPLGGSGAKPQIAPGGGAVVFVGEPGNASVGQPGQRNVFRVPLARNGAEVDPVDPQTPQCLSCRIDGGSELANGDSANSSLSADGTTVVFETAASNLVTAQSTPCASQGSQLVLRNVLTGTNRSIGLPAQAGQCGAALAGSGKPRIDYSGQRVVFESTQPLAGNDRNARPDVYLADLRGGGPTLLSQSAAGLDSNGDSLDPRISGDGRVVSFVSAGKNLEPRDVDNNETRDLHVFDLRDGAVRRLASTTAGAEANAASDRPALDYNGKLIAFESIASNLTADTVAGQRNVFLRENPLLAGLLFAAGFE